MKKLSLFLLGGLMTLAVLSVSAKANTTFEINVSDDDTYELAHDSYYIWKITLDVPDGGLITDAEISLYEIYNYYEWEKNILFLQLLSPDEISGINFDSYGIYTGDDSQLVLENSIQPEYGGIELTTYTDYDGPITVDDLTYTFSEEEVALLNTYITEDGTIEFALGIDPDCHYFFGRPRWFWFRGHCWCRPPQVIPAPGAILLGGIGICLVGWLRRRRTL